MVTAPMDCAGSRSNTGRKVVAPLMDFHTPPLADPTNTVILPFSSTASTAEIRPPMVADPMFLAVNPEMVPESYLTGAGVWAVMAMQNPHRKISAAMERTGDKR